MLVYGFTGTQAGMTAAQKMVLRDYLLKVGSFELHHGDCLGADADMHIICAYLPCNIIIHPPTRRAKRAYCSIGHYDILPAKDYIARNHDIVDACKMLIATPGQEVELRRSGTWATIRYARKIHRNLMIVFPNGSIALDEFGPAPSGYFRTKQILTP